MHKILDHIHLTFAWTEFSIENRLSAKCSDQGSNYKWAKEGNQSMGSFHFQAQIHTKENNRFSGLDAYGSGSQ
jgi:hypothetical protein